MICSRQHQPHIPLSLEAVIDLDQQNENIDDDDADDAYEDIDDEGQDHHPEPVEAGKGGKTEKSKQAEKTSKTEKAGHARQTEEEKPVEGEDKEDESSNSGSGASDDSDDGAQGAGPSAAALSSPSDDKGTVEVPKESPNTVVIGLKVYTNKDVGCTVEGRLRMGCKLPNCTLCAPPVVVTIPAAGEEKDGDS